MKLECNQLNNQFLNRQNNGTNEQGEQYIGDRGQVVSTDSTGLSFIPANDQWLESDPSCKGPGDEFGVSTQISDYVFVLLGRGDDGADSVSPEGGEHHEYSGRSPESDPEDSEPDRPPHLAGQSRV